MRVDFYHLTRDPAEAVLPALARNTLKAGERMVIVSSDAAHRGRISEALWTSHPESFLAHGEAVGEHDVRQPILLSGTAQAANGAGFLALADGEWREAEGFGRVFLLFDAARIDAARACWRELGTREAVERRYWKQDGGKWVEGP